MLIGGDAWTGEKRQRLEVAFVCLRLSARSGYRHPVLDAVEGLWPTVEKAMKQRQRSEFLYEVSCYALVALCGNCRAHMPRYG